MNALKLVAYGLMGFTVLLNFYFFICSRVGEERAEKLIAAERERMEEMRK